MRNNLSPFEVEVPVQRGWTWFVDILTGLSLVVLAAWWFSAPADLSQSGRVAVLLLALAATAIGWSSRRSQPARLRWDGKQWFVAPLARDSGPELTPGSLRVIVDLQFVMLLRFESGGGIMAARWFVVDCCMLRRDWHLLRSATFRRNCGEAGAGVAQRLEARE